MNDKTTALLYLAAAGAVFLFGPRLLARVTGSASGGASGYKPRRLACLGDSITEAGYYCNDLAGIFGCEVKVFGYAGQGTGSIGSHVDEVLDWRPDAVVVLAGVNDLPSSSGAAVAIAGSKKIYAKLKAGGVERVVAVEITPWHGYASAVGHESNTDAVNLWIRHEALVDGRVKTSSLGDYSGYLKDKYSAGDGLHLNREGHAALAVLIADQGF